MRKEEWGENGFPYTGFKVRNQRPFPALSGEAFLFACHHLSFLCAPLWFSSSFVSWWFAGAGGEKFLWVYPGFGTRSRSKKKFDRLLNFMLP
jgi:hypothetical protein